jgi:hypothetical protein
MSEVARYKVLATSYIHKQILFEGDEVEYDGKPGSALEPINDAAKEAKKKADKNYVEPEPEGDKPLGLNTEGGGSNQADIDLAALRDEYQALFNAAPHPAMKAETMKTKIAEKRAELGV